MTEYPHYIARTLCSEISFCRFFPILCFFYDSNIQSPGGAWDLQILANRLTLFKPGWQIMAAKLLLGTCGSKILTEALRSAGLVLEFWSLVTVVTSLNFEEISERCSIVSRRSTVCVVKNFYVIRIFTLPCRKWMPFVRLLNFRYLLGFKKFQAIIHCIT